MPRPTMRARTRRIALAAVAVVGALLLPITALVVAAPAMAAGSDGPTPYTVTASGVTLPDGATFQDNGHVNVRYVVDGRQRPANAHFEAKCVTRSDAECAGERHDLAQFIGQRTLPWDAMGLPANACIVWVQMSAYNEHFGEGGQAPVCRTTASVPAPPAPTTPSEPTPTTPSEPAPTTPSEPTPTTPSEPAVVHPQIQDYVGACDAAFVLDNSSSTVDVTYTVNGVSYLVAAGTGIHTDADGTRIAPVDGQYVITTDSGRTWTFPARSCVVEPQIQDYVAACDAAFVLDNSSSTVDVTYTVNGVSYRVPAGTGIHTDADGTRIAPVDGQYVITTDTGRTWTFPARACGVTPVPSEPAPSEPAPSEPTPSEPAPSDPAPSDPAPSDPAPSDPAPSEPAPSEPAPSGPTPSDPGTDVPAVEEPTPSEPTPSEPAPSDPAPSDPAPSEPTPSEPAPSDQPAVDVDPAVDVPASAAQPAAAQPTAAQPTAPQPTAVASSDATSLPRTGGEPLLLVLLLGGVLMAVGATVRLARR
ncbi:hypothetical protein GCM10009846_27590 [Agrococcus versicolor]|uniref:Gram-positive cocci surface proteins LPxTG domain-containing protein n=1 Tax=Agrococcus versicolor TaxID=501482 RepID=A0ABN3AY52_9MICO